jgi:hypothetical protein
MLPDGKVVTSIYRSDFGSDAKDANCNPKSVYMKASIKYRRANKPNKQYT